MDNFTKVFDEVMDNLYWFTRPLMNQSNYGWLKAHMEDHQEVLPFLEEAIHKMIDNGIINTDEDKDCAPYTVSLGRTIGRSGKVELDEESSKKVYMASRGGGRGESRMIHRLGPETDKVTIIAIVKGGQFMLITAWIGDAAAPETDTEYWYHGGKGFGYALSDIKGN